MSAIRYNLRGLGRDERGATAIEYGLIVGLIAVAAITGFSLLGGGSNGIWTDVAAQIAAAMKVP